ncbi:MAG: BrnT family toxin [Anaerolineae bacterium]|nr:BrnT family toxin [Anaerolineae bacterium]MBT7072310.1 BrnT family toxin [Anaerolineae bacterium]MBT7326030.1 BrnT family toxin [Anaerolineae bacterium]
MNFEWDENKRRENIRKHGIDFVDLPPLFDGVIITIEDRRHDYGETRYITLGLLKHHVIVVVHTDREGNIRIISARKATKNESKRYFEEITN